MSKTNTHFEILIDASGSMGYMKGTDLENHYTLPDKSTRTSLVKLILENSIIDQLSNAQNININTFRDYHHLDKNNKPIIKIRKVTGADGKLIDQRYYSDYPDFNNIYTGNYLPSLIKEKLKLINDPSPGGTPLVWAITSILMKSNDYTNLIVLSDGDASDSTQFDIEILEFMKIHKTKCKIYFIGIDQNSEAERKSRKLVDFSNGKYVNVKAINYDKELFDNFLFEIKSSIIQDAISTSVAKNTAEIYNKPRTTNPKEEVSETENQSEEENLKKDQQETVEETKASQKETEIKEFKTQKFENEEANIKPEALSKLEQEVANNSNSISGISNQLDTLVNQIKYLNKIITSTKEDDDSYFDSDINEAENKITGWRCEEYLFGELLKNKWDEVVWMNEKGEYGEPYDFIIRHKGSTYYVECKGTKGNSNEFSITKSEWLFYLTYKPNYRLYFVSNLDTKEPNVQKLDDLITSFENQDLIPFSAIDRKVKADRFWIQVDNRKS